MGLRKKKKKTPRADCIREGQSTKISINNDLYDAWDECIYDACSNALKFVQFHIINQKLT